MKTEIRGQLVPWGCGLLRRKRGAWRFVVSHICDRKKSQGRGTELSLGIPIPEP
jgi:hypothetical protein